MTQKQTSFFTTPVGRLVWGSVVRPKTKDSQGRPLLIKSGPDAGKPTQKFEFGLAIPKASERDWRDTTWGKLIVSVAVAGFPNGSFNNPSFAWKVIDGDSQIPNTRGVKPCSREGWPGHWVLSFSSSFAPETLDSTGAARIDPASIKTGYYVQVAGSIAGNRTDDKPGVFLNARFVSFQWAGKEIIAGPDPTQLGFGGQQAPSDVAQPTGSFIAPAMQQPQAAVNYAPSPVAPSGVTPPPPHVAILVPPVPAPGPVMTPKAGLTSYDAFLKAGWTHPQLVANGYVVA